MPDKSNPAAMSPSKVGSTIKKQTDGVVLNDSLPQSEPYGWTDNTIIPADNVLFDSFSLPAGAATATSSVERGGAQGRPPVTSAVTDPPAILGVTNFAL